jgi:hypothetical protein
MVVGDFQIVGISLFPAEADAPLLVDPDAVLAEAVTCQGFQPVCGRDSQIIQVDRLADHREFVQGTLLNWKWQAFGSLLVPYFLGFLVRESLDHEKSVMLFPFGVNSGF